jgi:hypothetical protein
MDRLLRPLSLRVKISLAVVVAAAAFLVVPSGIQASQQSKYYDKNGGYYCDGECPGKGCCEDGSYAS